MNLFGNEIQDKWWIVDEYFLFCINNNLWWGWYECWMIFIFLWEPLVSIFGESFKNCPVLFFFFCFFLKIFIWISHFETTLIFKKIKTSSSPIFKVNESHNFFESSISKGGFHKSIIINQGFLFFIYIYIGVFFFLNGKWKLWLPLETNTNLLPTIIMKNHVSWNYTAVQLKFKKTTHLQLLCNYPLGISTTMQLSF